MRANNKRQNFVSCVVFVRSRVFSERFLREVGVLDTTGSKKSFREREREKEREGESAPQERQTDADRRRKTEKDRE